MESMETLEHQLQMKLRRQANAVEITTQQLEDVRALLEHNKTKK